MIKIFRNSYFDKEITKNVRSYMNIHGKNTEEQ